jgi:hypothetical protein
MTCLGTFFMGVVLFYLLEIFTCIKLKKGGNNSMILKVLTKKDSTGDYKFSQFSTGDNSIKTKQSKMLGNGVSPFNNQEDYTGKMSKHTNSTIKLDAASSNIGSQTIKLLPKSLGKDLILTDDQSKSFNKKNLLNDKELYND